MPDYAEFENARQAFDHARSELKKCEDKMRFALQKADLASSPQPRDLFKQQEKRALAALQKAMEDLELAREVMQEIASGMPRDEQLM